MIRPSGPAIALILLAGCASATLPPVQERGGGGGMCRQDGLERFVGQIASTELGTRMLAASGARLLRWVPPDTAVTMDYSPQRLTVSYDMAMRIERLSCG